MLSAEENHHKRRLLVAGFDWPPGRSPGRNPGPLCDSSVSVFVPRSSNYAQLHVFIWEWMGGEKREVAALAVEAACEGVILALHSSVPVMLRTDAN